MAPLKALGLDGLHVIFLQSQWEVVEGSMCELIWNIFDNPKTIRNINETMLVLIPKIKNPEHGRSFQHDQIQRILEIIDLLYQEWEVGLSHVYRE